MKPLLKVAKTAAKKAGKFLLSRVQDDVVVNEAHHHDLKIQLDVDTQELLTRHILKAFPQHAILGEEGEMKNAKSDYEWILDPIDGTVNFTYGIPHFCISIACRKKEEILAGVVFDPSKDELFYAAKGTGAFCNGRPIHASKRSQLQEAILSLGFSRSQESIEKCLALYQYYGQHARKLRAMGSAALDLVYVAAGRFDAYIEQDIKIWDIAAGKLILEEAGGKVELTCRDLPHHYFICASNGCLEFPLL